MIDLEELKKLALAATPGPWEFDTGFVENPILDFHLMCGAWQKSIDKFTAMTGRSDDDQSRLDALFIAAADPTVILDLIERLERAEQKRANAERVGKAVLDNKNYWAERALQAEKALRKAEYRYEIAIRHANRRAEANKEMALTFSPPAKALSVFKAWWAMNEAEWGLTDTAVSDSEIILHYSGCGASCHVTAGDIRELVSGISAAHAADSAPEPTAPVERPHNCRNRLRDEGKPYPKSGCKHCKTGGLTGCPFERGGA